MSLKNKHKKFKKIEIIFWVFFVLSSSLTAQVFPVQVTPQVIPPYSLKLSDYGTAASDRLIVNLLLIDINETNRQVGLRLFIETNDGVAIRSTVPVVGANPIRLDGGIPLRLTNADLQAYFSLQNLVGISPQQYNTTLPEGLYRFCFEVYDYLSGQVISRKSCATAYLVLNDPPFLNMPNRDEVIKERDPQNIVFNWTPRHLNATNVQYEFTLAELWDTQMDPQAAFLASRPLYQTNTFATTLLYGPGETSLIPDKMYAWRVRATVSDGISETSSFRNDGYSEIYHFTYTGNCTDPAYILAEGITPTTEQVMWQGEDHLRYRVEYRKKGVENAVWFEVNTLNEMTRIYNLEPGTTYEFRVGGQCMENMGFTYSQIYEFTTMIAASDTATYNCGITPEVVITNQEPLQALVINDVFTAGDFPVTVKFVGSGNVTPTVTDANNSSLFDTQSMNSNGVYSGWGFITVPYLQNTKIKVSFNEISINSDYQLIGGMVVTDYDENWGGVDDIGNELDVLLSFGEAIIEALELDISSDTSDRIDQITDAILDQIDEESFPDEIQESITDAVNDMQQANEDYQQARENFENASNEEERETAKEEMDAAEEAFNNAQDNLEQANNEANKYKEKVTNLLRKAILELYREGRDKEKELLISYEKEYEKVTKKRISSSNIVTLELVPIDNQSNYNLDSDIKGLYEKELTLSLYLFSKVLNDGDEKTIDNLINKSREEGTDLLMEVKEIINQSDKEIIDRIKELLIISYTDILLNYKF